MNMPVKPPGESFVKTKSLIAGTFVSTDLRRVRRMFEGVFGMECVQPANDVLYARDRGFGSGGDKQGEPYWVLEVRKTDTIAVPQEMLNHWGCEAPSQAAVDEAYEKLAANKEAFGIARVQKPRFRNGSYALYFFDDDSNWWEVEYREPELVYTALRKKGDQVTD